MELVSGVVVSVVNEVPLELNRAVFDPDIIGDPYLAKPDALGQAPDEQPPKAAIVATLSL